MPFPPTTHRATIRENATLTNNPPLLFNTRALLRNNLPLLNDTRPLVGKSSRKI